MTTGMKLCLVRLSRQNYYKALVLVHQKKTKLVSANVDVYLLCVLSPRVSVERVTVQSKFEILDEHREVLNGRQVSIFLEVHVFVSVLDVSVLCCSTPYPNVVHRSYCG